VTRPPPERLQIACFALVGLIGAGVLAGAFALDGISIGGDSCGGAGAEQACREIDRALSVGGDLRWFSAAVVAWAVALAGLGVVGLVVPPARLVLSLAVLGLALAGLVAGEHVDSRFCPGEPRATCGRPDGEWGPVLRDPLLDLRADTRRALVGRPVEPGGPPAEAAQTLETFRASGLDGWTVLRRLSVILWFVALTLLVPRFVRTPWKAALAVVTLGAVSWAFVSDRMHPCEGDGSECYQGLLTVAAAVAAGLAWAVAFAAAAVARLIRRHI